MSMVERVAKAIYESDPAEDQETDIDGRALGKPYLISWDQICEFEAPSVEEYRKMARAAIAAMSAGWNFDTSQAPRGRMVTSGLQSAVKKRTRFVPARVILATKCGKVTLSQYVPDEERWMMLAKGEEPVAWQPWPEHPQPLVQSDPTATSAVEAA